MPSVVRRRPHRLRRFEATIRRIPPIAAAGTIVLLAALAPPAARAGDRWAPWGVIHAEAGSDVIGGADLFAPLWQSESSMLFADLRGSIDTDDDVQGHAGLGVRHLFGAWLAGSYAYFDIDRTEHRHTFLQGSAGVEVMTEDWEVRLNGYLPERQEKKVHGYRLTLVSSGMGGQTLRFRDRHERAFGGGDLELGWRPPLFRDCDSAELRVFAGGFYRDTGGYDALIGPTGRLELRLFDLPLLPQGSRLTVGGEVRWDDERGTWGAGMLRLRIPFNFFGTGGEKLAGMNRRMVDRPVHAGVVTRTRHDDRIPMTPTGVPVGDVAYADGDTMGDARSVPTAGEIETAIGVAGAGGIIVALDQTGPIDPVNDDQTIALLPGQILMGGGSSVTLTNGPLTGVFHAPGGRGLFQTSDEIVHFELADDNLVQSIDIDGGYIGIRVLGNNASIHDIDIRNIASVSPILDDTAGVWWGGDDGRMQDVRIGDVTSFNGQLHAAGVSWWGDRGWLSDVTIGNVSSTGDNVQADVVSALFWIGDDGVAQNVAAGNVSSVWDEARALWISTEGSRFTNISIGNVTSTNDFARGIHSFQLSDGTVDVSNVSIGDVTGGTFADGIFWFHGEGVWDGITIGNVTGNTNSANGVFRTDGIGGSITNLTIGNITGAALGGAGGAAALRLSFSDNGTYSSFSAGNITSTAGSFGFGIIAMNGADNVFSNGLLGNVSATGSNNAASGVRLDSETGDLVSHLTIGHVTLIDSGIGAFQGARGIDEFGSTGSIFDDIDIGSITANGIDTNATGIFWAGIDGMATDVVLGHVSATGAGSHAYGVSVSGNGSLIEDVLIDDVSGPDVFNTFVIHVIGNAFFGHDNEISLVRVPVNPVTGNGVYFAGPQADFDTGVNNSATLMGLGFMPCVDDAGTYTGSSIQFNVVNFCP